MTTTVTAITDNDTSSSAFPDLFSPPSTTTTDSGLSSASSSSSYSRASRTDDSVALTVPATSSSRSSAHETTTQLNSSLPTNTFAGATSSNAGASTSLIAASATDTSQSGSSPSWLTVALFGGVVAGSFVVGAVIAGLFTFALLKRRTKRSQNVSSSRYYPESDHRYSSGKASAMSTVTTLAESNFLPQQTEDAEAKKRILGMTDQIDQHVENFYRNSRVNVDESVEANISAFETRQMPNPLASCFDMAAFPLVLIRHCLAFHIFSQTVAPGEDTELMLPADIAGMVSRMYQKCLSSATPRDTIAAFSLWKNVTGYLRSDQESENASMQKPSIAAYEFAKIFSESFSAWSNPQYTAQHRIDHLAALVDHAIDTGTWLFQQPDSYKFDWNTLSHDVRNSTSRMMMRETVVVPGISKVTHSGALLKGQGQSVVQPTIRPF